LAEYEYRWIFIAMKRLFDLLLGAVALMLLAAPMILIIFAARLPFKGSALYWSNRVGRDN